MSWQFDVRPMMVLAAVPAAIAGCSHDGGDETFRISAIAFDNDATITLTFTHPVADLADVDPNDFRLSLAQTRTITYTYEGMSETYEYTSYAEVASFDPGNYQYLMFDSVARGASANQLVLEGNFSFGELACGWAEIVANEIEMYTTGEYAEYFTDVRFEVGIFLHYAAGDVPVENQDGAALANIGEDWVLNDDDYVYTYTYGFTKLTPKLKIPCP